MFFVKTKYIIKANLATNDDGAVLDTVLNRLAKKK